MTADHLLSRLDKVRKTGHGQWMARCPCPEHDDLDPSLGVRELPDGRVLLHCFGGCDTTNVLSALGLSFVDLYPERPIDYAKPERRPFDAFGVLLAIRTEATIVSVAAGMIERGEALTPADLARVGRAGALIDAAVNLAGGAP